jgi:hypothetical protein
MSPSPPATDSIQYEIIVYLAGYLARKWMAKFQCKECDELILRDVAETDFLQYKQFPNCELQRCNKEIVRAISMAESAFVASGSSIFHTDGIIEQLMQRTISLAFPTCDCHPSMRDFFLRNYFVTRVHHSCKLLTAALKDGRHCLKKKEKRLNIVAKRVLQKSIRISNKKRQT